MRRDDGYVARARSWAAVLGVVSVGAVELTAGEVESVRGLVLRPTQLERYAAIDDASGLELLGVYDVRRADPGFSFPEGDPLGAATGTFRFTGGQPLYFTVSVRFETALYAWASNADNRFDTATFAPGKTIRSIRVWGRPSPTCAGVRGNGPRIWAHFSSLARWLEHYGLLGGMAGGSSGSVTVFLGESVHAHPLVSDCGERLCTAEESQERAGLLFKSLEGLTEAGLTGDFLVIVDLLAAIEEEGVRALLEGGQPQEGVDALLDILSDPAIAEIVNPEVVALLLGSPDPVFHALDVIDSLANAASFVVEDPLVFVRPGIVNFAAVTDLFGRLGNFLAGYGEGALDGMQDYLTDCARPGRFLRWTEVAALPSGESSCGETFTRLFEAYLDGLPEDPEPSRLDDPIGRYLPALVTTAVLDGEAVGLWNEARAAYLAAAPIDFAPDYADLEFGYWGRADEVVRVGERLAELYGDPKSARFTHLGEASWRDILQTSPAEPGLSRIVELPDGRLSAGGWVDPVPTQVLDALECESVVLINRLGGIGEFSTSIATLLGATESDLDDLFDLGSPDSSFSIALERAEGIWCTDWDRPDTFDVTALSAEGYTAPLETSDPLYVDATELYPNLSERLDVAGCTPGVE